MEQQHKFLKIRKDFNNAIKHIKLIFIEQYTLVFSTVLTVQANAIGNNKRKYRFKKQK